MLKEYSSYFVAYLLYNLEEQYKENIQEIILFGSVARGEAEKKSDVDIFINVKKKTKRAETEIKKIEEKFYNSRESSLFKIQGINNRFSLIIGNLDEWKELKASIESTGVLLYGKYVPVGNVKGRKYTIVFWDKIGKNRGAFLNKIYGVKIKNKTYKGLIENFHGKKLGKSCVMFPIQYKEDIFKLLKEYEVIAKMIEVFS